MRVAILDMNNNVPNKGLGYLINLVERYREVTHFEVFDVRAKHEIPDLSFDIYLSSGGPGSPFELEGWSERYFALINALLLHNRIHEQKKYVFFICHSFQVACIHFNVGKLSERHIMSFGVHPVFPATASADDPIFCKLPSPFYAADFRYWQLTQPNHAVLDDLGAEILAIEQPQGDRERAVMAIRFTDEMLGTQFHPEADAPGMLTYLHEDDRRYKIIEEYGEEGYRDMLMHVSDPARIALTHKTILPMFIERCLKAVASQPVLVG